MEIFRIILADDQLLVREGMRALLDTLPHYEVVADCADGAAAIDAVGRLHPDAAILDIDMPGISGIEATQQIHAANPGVEILILSAIDRREIIEQALNAGASGYLHKDFVLDELRFALDAVLAGSRYLSPRIRERLSNEPDGAISAGLTSRQTEILRLVASGLTNKEAARALSISPKTVEFHRAQIMHKLGANDVTALTRYAMQHGLIG
jgi:DNA-binding NarL/FixJ family response regulator